jgi:hypothetical protein
MRRSQAIVPRAGIKSRLVGDYPTSSWNHAGRQGVEDKICAYQANEWKHVCRGLQPKVQMPTRTASSGSHGKAHQIRITISDCVSPACANPCTMSSSSGVRCRFRVVGDDNIILTRCTGSR